MSVIAALAVPHPPLIFPEVGQGAEAYIQETINAYREAMAFAASLKPDTLVIASAHATAYGDYFHISPGLGAEGDFEKFDAPEVKVKVNYDLAFTGVLSDLCKENHIEAGTMAERDKALDHGTMIPLRFFKEAYKGSFKVVRMGLSGLSPLTHYKLGQMVQQTAEKLNRRVVFIASGDLSHKMSPDSPYGFVPEGPAFDEVAVTALGELDFLPLLTLDDSLCTRAAECGRRAFLIMAGALDKKAIEGGVLSYEGPFGVGDTVAAYQVTGEDAGRNLLEQYEALKEAEAAKQRETEDVYQQLARYALEGRIHGKEIPPLPEELASKIPGEPRACFVSIYEEGHLRGCVGTTGALKESLAQEIMENAVAAGTCDPRFAPVSPLELPKLSYSVDVLSPLEAIPDKTGLDPKVYGVLVQAGDKEGLLLPDLEGVDTVSDQLRIAKKKAGIGDLEQVSLFRFTVERHG